MKREIDLCRQLLFDLEAKGPDCAINILRSGLANEADDRLRYHLRLLIDAGLVKEVERIVNGVACVRLTNAGIELIELCRSDARWRDAKAVVLERTGGMSLTVIRTVLTKWAVEAVSHSYVRRPRHVVRPVLRRTDTTLRYNGRYDDSRYERDLIEIEDELPLVRNAAERVVTNRSLPDYIERYDSRDRYEIHERLYNVPCNNGYRTHAEALEPNVGVSLPIYLV